MPAIDPASRPPDVGPRRPDQSGSPPARCPWECSSGRSQTWHPGPRSISAHRRPAASSAARSTRRRLGGVHGVDYSRKRKAESGATPSHCVRGVGWKVGALGENCRIWESRLPDVRPLFRIAPGDSCAAKGTAPCERSDEVNRHGYRTGRTGRRAGIVDAAPSAGLGGTLGRGDHDDPGQGRGASRTRWPPAGRRAGCWSARPASTCSSRTRRGRGPVSRWPPGGSAPTRSTSRPPRSSLSKGETFIDTAKNIEAMGVDAMIVRHRTPGTPHLLAQNLHCSVINAGDGAARASDARAAGHPDDPPAQRADRGADRGPGRRHRPQPHRPVEHLGARRSSGRT